jgi:hypothetical protein
VVVGRAAAFGAAFVVARLRLLAGRDFRFAADSVAAGWGSAGFGGSSA